MSTTANVTKIADGVFGVQTTVKLGGGASLPLRMTVLRDGEGIALVSPIAIDDDLAAELDQLGEVHTILAPNLFHHRHLPDAVRRYPKARLLGAPGLEAKRADLSFDGSLATGPVSEAIEAIIIEGVPKLAEVVFFHRPSSTLVVTDLVFNIADASGMTWFVLACVSRALGRVEQSRLFRWLTKDRTAAEASVESVLALPFQRVVPAHGAVIEADAQAELRAGLWWMRGEPRRPAVA